MATIIRPEVLLRLYREGRFPMASEAGRIHLFSPDPRGILPLDGFRIPHGSRNLLARHRCECRIDTAFDEVIGSCAGLRRDTWIDPVLATSYRELHRLGHAHSVETWQGGVLIGGLYGVKLGGAFFGESMFSAAAGGSKIALAALVAVLRAGGFTLLDTQWLTPHLAMFGGIEISRAEYIARLETALATPAIWPPAGPWQPEPGTEKPFPPLRAGGTPP